MNTILKYTVVGDMFISVTLGGAHSAYFVSDEDWREFAKALRTETYSKYLSATMGKVSTTSTQRKEGADILKRRGVPNAVVTDDALVRGMVTAVSWLGVQISAFSWADTRAAMQYLHTTGAQGERALEALTKLRDDAEHEQRLTMASRSA